MNTDCDGRYRDGENFLQAGSVHQAVIYNNDECLARVVDGYAE